MSEVTAVGTHHITVGVSVSEPSDDELIERGLSEMHVRHAFIEVVRHVLAAGWSVAYGGDLRARGYTECLLDLVRTYDRAVLSGPDRVTCYFPWPMWTSLTSADRAQLANLTKTMRVPAPRGAPDSLAPIPSRTPEERWWNAMALTAMRRQMIGDLGATVILGGRVAGQQGLYPGVFEEAVIAADAAVPMYVAGGFGGCGGLVARAIRGETPHELSIGYHRDNTPGYADLLAVAEGAGSTPEFESALAGLSSRGFDGLSNGLDQDENRRLAETIDVDEVIALVMRGLFKLSGRAP